MILTTIGDAAGYNVTLKSEPIVDFTFEVKLDPGYPSVLSSLTRLDAVKLSDPYGSKIDCSTRSATYSIRSQRPHLSVSPLNVNCKVGDACFTVKIRIAGAIYVSGFSFRLKYDSTLLYATEVTVGDFLKGPYSKVDIKTDDIAGYVRLSMEQTYPANGTGTLAIIVFTVKRTIVYRWWPDEANALSSYFRLEETELNVTYPRPGVLRQTWTEVSMSGAAYSFTPIPGDLNLDGKVDIADLVTIANYGCRDGCPFDLNGNGIVDIYDVVLVALDLWKGTSSQMTHTATSPR